MTELSGTLQYPDGLRPGQAKDGGLSSLLYDGDGTLVDHAVFHPDDPTTADDNDGPTTLQSFAAGVMTTLTAIAVTYASVRFKRWRQTRRTVVEQDDQHSGDNPTTETKTVTPDEKNTADNSTTANACRNSARPARNRSVAAPDRRVQAPTTMRRP